MELLKVAWPELSIELKTFKTQGDIVLETALSKIGDKGLFVKELEVALFQNEIDIAVHSLKDLPSHLPEGLIFQSAGHREDPRDVLLSCQGVSFFELPSGSVVGTSSLRRVAQLKRIRPDLIYQTIRGNLQTRYRKMEEGQYQAIVLAAAGVHRMGWRERIVQYFDPVHENIPAVGQGILAIEFRESDGCVHDRLERLKFPEVETAMQAERAMLITVEGGCQLPFGAHATQTPTGEFQLHAIILNPEGDQVVSGEQSFTAHNAYSTGEALAKSLLSSGGLDILNTIRQSLQPSVGLFNT
jgi:hydroxymethylbilane synthase